jgi:peptidyl-prolyl cis-trans isomerase D
MAEERDRRTGEATTRLSSTLPGARDVRATAKAGGAVADTLSMIAGAPRDSLFTGAFADSLLGSAIHTRGTFQGPRRIGRYVTWWRVDNADTAFVKPYDLVRAASDQGFAEEKRLQDEADAKIWFEGHRDGFRTPVKYGLDYVAVTIAPPDSVKVPDADVRRWYDTHPQDYRQEEQVRARHILFLTRGAGPDVDRRAKASADSLLAAIRKNGGDFAELARKFSQEPGASASGGDLGWFGHGRMVPEFDKAAFALRPGGISAVVKTAFGYHIIKLEDRREGGVQPFGEVRIAIRTQLAQARADSLARRSALALRRRLAAPPAKGAKPPDVKLVSVTPIAAPDPIPGLGVAQGLAADLPGLAAGRWAPGAYRSGNLYVIVKLREKLPEAPAAFEEVRAQAVEAMKNAKRRALLDAKVAAARAALAAGASLDSLAAPYGGMRESGLVGRTAGFVPTVGNEPRVVERAFTMQAGERSDTLQVAQGVLWLRVGERKTGDPATYGVASAQISAELTKQRYDQWVDERKQAVKIEILRPDLKPAVRPPAAKMVTLGG